jgi:hypothetical protein
LLTRAGHAQDASAFVFAGDSAVGQDAVAAVGDAEPPVVNASEGSCEEDPVPAGHQVRVETRVEPGRPKIGDRVIVTYRLFANSSDRVEFEPDPAVFAQPSNELEFARSQPDRDRRAHAGPNGTVYGEVAVAVQSFKPGEIVIPRQLARLNAGGEIVRVCTPAVRFRVSDPFGNEPHPRPRDLTPPEEVTADSIKWRYVMFGLNGAFLLVLATLGVNAYMRSRPKVEPPPPPPVPAWILALEGLDVLSRSDLLSRGLTKDYYDQLSDVVRRYIGALRGFDALEMTSDEVLWKLRKVPVAGVATTEIEHLLRECDLVKFARYVPSHEESEQILEQAYVIVRRSSPAGGSARSSTTAEQAKTEPSAPSVTVEQTEKRG